MPHDSYAMSKVVNEATARSFQARPGIDIYGLRINNVIEPHEYATKFPAFVADPGLRRRNIFAYIDARDLGHMVDRCLRTDGLGYQVFNVVERRHVGGITSDEVYERFYAGVPRRREMGRTRRSTPTTRPSDWSASRPATPGARCWRPNVVGAGTTVRRRRCPRCNSGPQQVLSRRRVGGPRRRPHGRRRGAVRHRGTLRVRQDDTAAHGRRPGGPDIR